MAIPHDIIYQIIDFVIELADEYTQFPNLGEEIIRHKHVFSGKARKQLAILRLVSSDFHACATRGFFAGINVKLSLADIKNPYRRLVALQQLSSSQYAAQVLRLEIGVSDLSSSQEESVSDDPYFDFAALAAVMSGKKPGPEWESQDLYKMVIKYGRGLQECLGRCLKRLPNLTALVFAVHNEEIFKSRSNRPLMSAVNRQLSRNNLPALEELEISLPTRGDFFALFNGRTNDEHLAPDTTLLPHLQQLTLRVTEPGTRWARSYDSDVDFADYASRLLRCAENVKSLAISDTLTLTMGDFFFPVSLALESFRVSHVYCGCTETRVINLKARSRWRSRP